MTRAWMAAAVVTASAMAAGATHATASSPGAQATMPAAPPAAPLQAQIQAQARMPVVASFSILGDLVEQVGGDRVAVTTLVGRDSDAHVFQPAPRDVKTVSAARVLVFNGRGFDGWMSRLASTGGVRAGRVTIDATAHLLDDLQASPSAANGGRAPAASQPRKDEHDHGQAHGQAHDQAKAEVRGHDHAHGHDHGTIDPHAWQDPRQVIGYVRAIAEGLTRADPNGAAYYAQRAGAYVQQLQALDAWIVKRLADVPAATRKVITSHDAFGYFAARYGVAMLAVSGVSTNADAGARDLANIIGLMRREKVKALFLENIANPRLIEQIARETGAEVGGRLYSDALSAVNGPAPTYLAMMRHNVDTLVAGMQRN